MTNLKHVSFPGLLAGIILMTTLLQGLVAQTLNDTLRLGEVEIRSAFINENPGYKRVKIDSILLAPNRNADLSTILSQHSTVFIKSYGNNSLSTPSFRGTSSSHTQVEWNGVSINSPMLGQTDFSQLPTAQFSGIDILYGASTLTRGSGVFGGVINLISNPDWNKSLDFSIDQTIASFENYTTNASMTIGNRAVQSITRVNYSSGVNDFPFYTDSGEKVNQENASCIQWGFSEEAFVRINRKNFLALRFWYSDNHHKIAPIAANIGKDNTEHQYDRAFRSMAEWKYLEKNYSLSLRSALVDQYMQYTDTVSYDSRTYTWNNRFRVSWTGIKRLTIKPGIDFIYDWAKADAYVTKDDSSGRHQRSTLGLFAEINWDTGKKTALTLILREDVIDGNFLPFIPSLGFRYNPFNRVDVTFSANIARNYRYPSLNDLYYAYGGTVIGNPNLKPESDYAVEGGGVAKFPIKNNRFYVETELTGYYSIIQDMIQWSPADGDPNRWKPENLNEVHARGLEAGLNGGFKMEHLEITMDNNYHFCRSTNEKANSPNDSQVGKQLRYVPVHTFNSTAGIRFRGFFFIWNLSYFSERFTGNDEKSMMPGYSISNIFLGKNFTLRDFILSLQGQINNLFDLDYQSVAQRPMPGRNYAITLKIGFNKKDQNAE